MQSFTQKVNEYLTEHLGKSFIEATLKERYEAIARAALDTINKNSLHEDKRAFYLSAEFLIGRMVYSNLYNLGLLDEAKALYAQSGLDIAELEDVEDAALGNGGLGRLAACFLDSAATHNIPLDGYGIRYRYGLFKQDIENGFQRESADDWQAIGDPFSTRVDAERVKVDFADYSVWAVPYDMPVIGYEGKCVNTLRLWQAEAVDSFNFDLFNKSEYDTAVSARTDAEAISAVLYPNDETQKGKELRLRQQYFFSSAALKDIIRKFKIKCGADFDELPSYCAIQLNDTHPTIAIPELLRILINEEHLDEDKALRIVNAVFAYTNHTVMAEAMEKWDVTLIGKLLPDVYAYIVLLNNRLLRYLNDKSIAQDKYRIIDSGKVHMARLAVYATHSVNGVAKLHTEILKDDVLHEWYELYPNRFSNKTNGITQRRWLCVCNAELSQFITEKIGDAWIKELNELKRMLPYASDKAALAQFSNIKQIKKNQLAEYVQRHDNIVLNPHFIFDVQAKRMHEYKRQLLNILSVLDIYYGIKDGSIKGFKPTAFIFAGKAAPGYARAKGVIKLIGEVGKLLENDKDVKDLLKVVFLPNYNVSYAEKLMPAADISEQISTAGTEASGTGNMKLMLNGAVTMGTWDGANIEIANEAGIKNEYIFGARVEDINKIKDTYSPYDLYNKEPCIKRVMDTLIDGTLYDGGTGIFRELYDSILRGASWHKADQYYLLLDLLPYTSARLAANADYGSEAFAQKCFINMASAGYFSSDRTVREYANEIWNIK
ncbi:MAG: glycogen/starch/alpha-glucan family phosphorylase [Oscillospiraceae bacterium]